jgi:hypothetical protein
MYHLELTLNSYEMAEGIFQLGLVGRMLKWKKTSSVWVINEIIFSFESVLKNLNMYRFHYVRNITSNITSFKFLNDSLERWNCFCWHRLATSGNPTRKTLTGSNQSILLASSRQLCQNWNHTLKSFTLNVMLLNSVTCHGSLASVTQ